MFDIAFSELVVIGIVMLVVIGPKRLPEVARTAGRWLGQLRRFASDVKRDMDVELRRDELAELRKVKEQLTETKQIFEQAAGDTFESLASIQPPTSPITSAEPAKALPGPAKKSARAGGKKTTARKPKTASRVRHGRATRKRH